MASVAADNLPTQSYTYKQSDRGAGYTTYQIASETIGEDAFTYTYDEAGYVPYGSPPRTEPIRYTRGYGGT